MFNFEKVQFFNVAFYKEHLPFLRPLWTPELQRFSPRVSSRSSRVLMFALVQSEVRRTGSRGRAGAGGGGVRDVGWRGSTPAGGGASAPVPCWLQRQTSKALRALQSSQTKCTKNWWTRGLNSHYGSRWIQIGNVDVNQLLFLTDLLSPEHPGASPRINKTVQVE